MVDFKGENTITTPNYQIVSVITLEAWLNCILAFERLEISDPLADDDYQVTVCRARLKALYRCIAPWMDSSDGDCKKLKEQLKSKKVEELELALDTMGTFLYKNGLLKINLKKPIDTIIAEDVNVDKGY